MRVFATFVIFVVAGLGSVEAHFYLAGEAGVFSYFVGLGLFIGALYGGVRLNDGATTLTGCLSLCSAVAGLLVGTSVAL